MLEVRLALKDCIERYLLTLVQVWEFCLESFSKESKKMNKSSL